MNLAATAATTSTAGHGAVLPRSRRRRQRADRCAERIPPSMFCLRRDGSSWRGSTRPRLRSQSTGPRRPPLRAARNSENRLRAPGGRKARTRSTQITHTRAAYGGRVRQRFEGRPTPPASWNLIGAHGGRPAPRVVTCHGPRRQAARRQRGKLQREAHSAIARHFSVARLGLSRGTSESWCPGPETLMKFGLGVQLPS